MLNKCSEKSILPLTSYRLPQNDQIILSKQARILHRRIGGGVVCLGLFLPGFVSFRAVGVVIVGDRHRH